VHLYRWDNVAPVLAVFPSVCLSTSYDLLESESDRKFKYSADLMQDTSDWDSQAGKDYSR